MESFKNLKDLIIKAPAFQPYNDNAMSFITVDAINLGISAILSQMVDGVDNNVAFASRGLSAAEKNYSTIEKEAVACVWDVHHFATYLWGREFVVVTDHKPLVFMWNDKGVSNASPMLIRLFSKLYEYNFTMKHIPGGKNYRADFLSRCPTNTSTDEMIEEDKEVVGLVDGFVLAKDVISRQDWEHVSAADQCQIVLKKYITSGWPREGQVGEEFKSYFKVKDEMSVEGVFLMRGSLFIPAAGLRSK